MQESQVAGGDQGAAMNHLPTYKGETSLPACLPSRNFCQWRDGKLGAWTEIIQNFLSSKNRAKDWLVVCCVRSRNSS